MRKYDWEKGLRCNLQSLSAEEQDKILDYYNEIFEDKRDRGEREADIIASFGNPVDAARKILRESQENESDFVMDGLGISSCRAAPFGEREDRKKPTENLYYNAAPRQNFDPAPCLDNEGNRSTAGDADAINHISGGTKIAIGVILIILFWIPILTISIAVAVICCAAVASFAGLFFAGAAITVFGISSWASLGAATGLVNIGAGLIVAGIGCLLMPICLNLGKFIWKILKAICKKVSSWVQGRRNVQ